MSNPEGYASDAAILKVGVSSHIFVYTVSVIQVLKTEKIDKRCAGNQCIFYMFDVIINDTSPYSVASSQQT